MLSRDSIDNRATIARKYPGMAELEQAAIVNQAWRARNPDPNRCGACHGTDHRMINVEYTIKDNGKVSGRTIGKIWREHRVCNRCQPPVA